MLKHFKDWWPKKDWWHTSKEQQRVGVHLAPNFVAITIISTDARELIGFDYFRSTPGGQAKALTELVDRNSCAGSPAYVALDGSDYEIRHTDAPQVAPEELAAALRFRLKDMVEIPFEQMAVAAHSQYSDRRQAQQQIALTGIARQQRITEIAETVTEAGLELRAVLMRETVLADLVKRLPEAEDGIALVYVGESDGIIAICRGDRLGLARRHFTGSEQIAAASADDSPYQSLATELQYSLDYHDGQLSTTSTSIVMVPPINGSGRDRIVDHLDEALPLKCSKLEPFSLFDLTSSFSPDARPAAPASDPAAPGHCLLALAAALPHPLERCASIYTPQRNSFNPLGAAALAGYLGSLVVLLGLISIILAWRSASLESHLHNYEERRAQLNSAIESIERQTKTAKPDPELVAKRNRLEEEQELLKRLRNRIEDIDSQSQSGFSTPLKSLANQRVDGLWLTRITIKGDDISLEGRTLEPRNVARLVNKLAEERFFAGRYFNELKIFRPEQGSSPTEVLEFRATTIPSSE